VQKLLNEHVIQGFVGSILAKRFDGSVPSPNCHREWWELCTSNHKFVAIAAPRGFAKSTAITFSYTLACVLFRERRFVVIISDTEAQAAGFLTLIKQELTENEELIQLFRIKRDVKQRVVFNKETETDLVVSFSDGEKFRIIAKGSEQKLRGLLWNGLRPDLIVCDDMENDEIVMNKERREKFKRWFYGALMPCRSKEGVIRYVGTILHMDSMLENLMPEGSDKKSIQEDLKLYTTKRFGDHGWKSVKYRACSDDYESLLWPERHTADSLKASRDDYRQRGLSDVWAQEYLNIPIDESTSYFKKADFLPLREEDLKLILNYYITVDLAISSEQKADFTCFLIAGVDENKRIHIKNIIKERGLDGREIVDTLIALSRAYKPVAVGIEESQISQSIGPFLNEAMIASNEFLTLYPMKHMGKDKVTRCRSIQARMRAKTIKFDDQGEWYQPFVDECLRFPRDKHDDQVDAFSYLGLMLDKLIEAPTPKEVEEQDYIEEYQRSGLFEFGRNGTTGY
jgi:predicted phage terminase large subunit-like protein